MGVQYLYATGDRLKNPYKYEYTPYEGSMLLQAYTESRDEIVQVLQSNLLRLAPYLQYTCTDAPRDVFEQEYSDLIDGAGLYIKQECGRVLERDGCICTVRLFADVLYRLLLGTYTMEDVFNIFIFLKKFELFKRIYLYYDEKTTRKVPGNESSLLTYPLFANVLAHYILAEKHTSKQTIAFNTLLKLNDTTASILGQIATPAETALALRSFLLEKEIYARYAEGLE